MMKQQHFERLGRDRRYDYTKLLQFPQHKLNILPGYDLRLILKEGGIFMNIESKHAVIRTESALDFIKTLANICENKGLSVETEI